jgi:hypothetical protein
LIGSKCPICGGQKCFRKISPYERTAIELDFDYDSTNAVHVERVRIARFLCRSTMRTFSLLPCQLLPYHRYTIATIVLALLLAHHVAETDHRGFSSVIEQWLPVDSVITGWLLACWLNVITIGFRRSHAWLAKRYDMSRISSAKISTARLSEVHTYSCAIFARGPPTADEIIAVAGAYGGATQRFLFGSPSQSRGRKSAS